MKVSVIIPTYNRAALLVDTIRSALDQTFLDREIIVIDDGSTDDTKLRLTPFADKISYVYQENRGVNAARNLGISIARGEYIALLDSDDLWRPFLLDFFVRILDDNPEVGFVYSEFSLLKPGGSIDRKALRAWYTYEDDWDRLFDSCTDLPPAMLESLSRPLDSKAKLFTGNIYRASLFHPTVLPSASLYRRSMVRSSTPFNEEDSTCGDWEFFAKLSNQHGAAFVDIETAYNRSHDDDVRLMRIDLAIRLRRQIDFVNRVWRSDSAFMLEFESDVYRVLRQLYSLLVKVALVGGDQGQARRTIDEFHASGIPNMGMSLFMWKIVSRIPGSAFGLRVVRNARNRLLHSEK